ncbi:outer membrane protein assembly factor BamA [candidate division TM6 bacterium RIFCSPHIGHO2_12_FULL_38_8]|nr:MAG: outer membrane protein assembly factor BamA [candidate division TM6 bacterium RIFCSPHIGHO2_12_FULL_38_8]
MALEKKTIMSKILVLSLSLLCCATLLGQDEVKTDPKTESKIYPATIDYEQRLALHESKRKINQIHVQGNQVISTPSILNRLPSKVGDVFSVNLTATMIKNLYRLGYFHQVNIYAEPIGDDLIDLYVVVQEKPKTKDFTFVGNKALGEKDLKEELKAETIVTLVPEELKALCNKIKKFYRKKNYHQAQVTAKLINIDDGRVSVEFTIQEGKKSFLNRISFKGNKHYPSKKLKRILISKEDWILGMIDHSGVYNPDMIEADKYMIEEAYRNNGFINAKVTAVDVVKDDQAETYHITFVIHEGDRYKIKSVDAVGNDIVSSARIKEIIPIFEGQIYSVENLRTAIENIRLLCGEYGYIFADIDPHLEVHDEDKTVTISFNLDLKDQVYLNRLTIRGNKKTRDKVIRRQILLDEGELITNQKMEVSKSCVGLLGYFDPKGGVNWKTTRIDNAHADLDLLVNEVKTGNFSANLSFGGSPTNRQTPQTGLNFSTSFGDKNFLGSGIMVASSIEISKKYRAGMASMANPWMFDRPIRGTMSGFIKASEYEDQIDIAQDAPYERAVGGIIGLGYVAKLFGGIVVDGKINFERITFENKVEARKGLGAKDRFIAQVLLDKYFKSGNQISFLTTMGQDKRNGLVFPTNGYQWNFLGQLTVPGTFRSKSEEDFCCKEGQPISNNFNYFKTELDVSWYTPLINEHDLVLGIHGNIGIVHPFKCKDVPWKNLYHMGGPTNIRGYTYGQVGPTWKGDSLGASKAFFLNIEFIVPLSSNLSTRGVIFYDGGAGWDTPYKDEFSAAAKAVGLCFETDFANNNFFYRHSVGIGVRIKSPTPLQVDFGIKLNPSKKFKKHLTEMHLSMEHSF